MDIRTKFFLFNRIVNSKQVFNNWKTGIIDDNTINETRAIVETLSNTDIVTDTMKDQLIDLFFMNNEDFTSTIKNVLHIAQ